MKEVGRQAKKAKCKKRILRVSRALFRSKGYEETTISEIINGAEISKGTFYNYFPTKESLLLGTAKEEMEKLGEQTGAERNRGLASIEIALNFLIIDTTTDVALTRKIITLAAEKENPISQIQEELREQFILWIQEGKEEGNLKKEIDDEQIYQLIIGIFYVAEFQWNKEQKKKENIEKMLKFIKA